MIPESFDKPFLTYEEMISLLQERNLTITDSLFAKRTLDTFSYYTLVNGYKNSYIMIPGTDSFVPGTTIEQLYTLHTLDASINHILLKYILYIEGALKSRISYIVSLNFGVYSDFSDPTNNNPSDYLFRNNYQKSSKRNNTLHKIKSRMASDEVSDSVKHYKKNHNHIPPWILTTSLSFGNAIMWYSILKKTEKEYVCNQFIFAEVPPDHKKNYLLEALDYLRKFRNRIAHGDRTFSAGITHNIPRSLLCVISNGIITSDEFDDANYRNGLLSVIAVIMTLLNDKYLLAGLLEELRAVLIRYIERKEVINGKAITDFFYLPNDIFERMTEYITKMN